MITETIYWHVDAGVLPDDELTVLVETFTGEVDAAFMLNGVWHWAASESPIAERVVAWTDMPAGTTKGGKGA